MAEIELFAFDCSQLEGERFLKEYQKQPKWRQKKIDKLKRRQDQLLSLGAGILLLNIFSKSELEHIQFGKNGKPFLEGKRCFNLSHSKSVAFLAVSNNEIGCDCQNIYTPKVDISKRVFSQNEQQLLAQSENKQKMLFRLWTIKESYIKATGDGLSIPLSSFFADFDTKEIILQLAQHSGYFFEEYEIENLPYCFSVCSKQKNDFPNGIKWLNFESDLK